MERRRMIPKICVGLVLGALTLGPVQGRGQELPGEVQVQEQPGYIQNFVNQMWGYVDPENAEIISVHQLSCLIDHLDECLYSRGQVVVKNPDVWGQNRMTQHRADYETQMKAQLNSFELILNSYQRVSDAAALTSATSVGASLGPRGNKGTSATPASIPSAVGLVGPSGLVNNANTLLAGGPSPVLTPATVGKLGLGNNGSSLGIGLEPTLILDERSNFINHLQQLRRVNAGDDRSDMPGYGLYLVRLPVSILPGSESIKGKGAMVTVQAKHNLTGDMLENTFRSVVILDTAYQLMDAVTRGQYLAIEDIKFEDEERKLFANPNACMPDQMRDGSDYPGYWNVKEPLPPTLRRGQALGPIQAGSPQGAHGAGPGSEVVAIYGPKNLRTLVVAIKQNQESWYRHDPSIVTWLLGELAAAHTYMRDQARLGNPAFQPEVFANLGHHVLTRNYTGLLVHRENWLKASAASRHEQVRPIDVLAFALIIQSVLVDRQLKYDMHILAQRKKCDFGEPDQYRFYNLWPDEPAKHAFNSYVEGKWPVHVFALDPNIEQQNQLDLYSARTQLQLALALALSSGQVSLQQATTYARNLEKDMDLISLNRTAVGFGAGETTFGWRFYPRVQTPPTQSNLARLAGILINNGPGTEFDLKNRQIEPGQRDCYALMVLPNFAPAIHLTTVANWFDLKTKHHPGQDLNTTDMVHLGRKLQTARSAIQRLSDSGHYRPADIEGLGERLSQLDAMLPIQAHEVMLPFEADLTGSEIFNSTNAGLTPRLLTWYGEPATSDGGSVFILGTGFNIDTMKVIVGGVTLKDPNSAAPPPPPGAPASYSYDIISRNVLRIDIPKTAKTIDTGVMISYPSTTTAAKNASSGTETVEKTTTTTTSNGNVVSQQIVENTKATVSVPQPASADPKTSSTSSNPLDAKANDVSFPLGRKFAAYVANFKLQPRTTPDQYVVTINWGDGGQTATRTIRSTDFSAAGGGRWNVVGQYTYDQPGPYTIVIWIYKLDASGNPDPTSYAVVFSQANSGPSAPAGYECKRRKVIDVHVATQNGISNHLLVEVPPDASSGAAATPSVVASVTTATNVNATTGTTTTKTDFSTTPPGVVLPPGTFLPMGTSVPSGGTFVSPGAATINNTPSGYQPGTVPSNFYQPMPPSPAPSAKPGGGTSMNSSPLPKTELSVSQLQGFNPNLAGETLRHPPASVSSRAAIPSSIPAASPARPGIVSLSNLQVNAATAQASAVGARGKTARIDARVGRTSSGRTDPLVVPASTAATRQAQPAPARPSNGKPPGAATPQTLDPTSSPPERTQRRSVLSRLLAGDK